MKPTALTCTLFLLFTATANSQFSIRPDFGLDRTRTTITQNNLSSFSPLQGEASMRAQLRMDYRLKNGFGPYAAFGTSPSTVEYNFSNPDEAMNSYRAATSALRFRMEAGFQYSTKAMNLGKARQTAATPAAKPVEQTAAKKSCGSYKTYSSCGSKKNESYARQEKVKQPKNLNMKIQPSVGLAYVPSDRGKLMTSNNAYQYNAGAWKTAVVPALALEFGKGRQRIGTVSLYYTKALGDLPSQQITTVENGKTHVNTFSSKQSAWGLSFGVPMTLGKKPATAKQKSTPSTQAKKSCGSSYKSSSYRCTRKI